MALLPSTAESRMVPVAGRQFAERRLMRGVGAAERAVGNAWGRMTSRQREYYGSQKNFVGGLQREANRRKSKEEEDEENAQREQGRQDAMGNAPPAAAPKANHAKGTLGKTLADIPAGQTVSMRNAGQDHAGAEPLMRYTSPTSSTPAVKRPASPASEQLKNARAAGRVVDDAETVEDVEQPQDRQKRLLAKGYQMDAERRFSARRQMRKPGSYGRQY